MTYAIYNTPLWQPDPATVGDTRMAMMTPVSSGTPMMPNQKALRLIRPMNSWRRMIRIVFTRAGPPRPSSG